MTNSQLAHDPAVRISSDRGAITLDRRVERCTVRFVGEIDASMPWDAVERLAEAVRSSAQPVHVDCSDVTFFSAEGLSMLALLKQSAPGKYLAALVTNHVVDLVLGVYPAGTYTNGSASF